MVPMEKTSKVKLVVDTWSSMDYGSQLESVDHTCMAPPLLRCSKKEFHFTLVFYEKYLDTNRLPKFAHS
jgi:hypothetical protein